jgi:prepilin-type N-terminal cleavage/methylation domain-containing protein
MRPYTYFKGFTLVELMVVMAIIAILAAVAMSNYQVHVLKSKVSVMVSRNKQLMEVTEQNIALHGSCSNPTSTQDDYWVTPAPEYIADPTNSVVAFLYRGSIPWVSGSCWVQTTGNNNVFGGRFALEYLSTPLNNLTDDKQNVFWQCYYEVDQAVSSRLPSVVPPGCLPRANSGF